jgi:hypothetical protein
MNEKIKEVPAIWDVCCKLADIANIDVETLDFSKEYYNKYTWTLEQQKEFCKWVVDYLYHKPDRQRQIMNHGYYSKPKYELKKLAGDLCWNHGWKLEPDEDRKKRLKKEKLNILMNSL